MLETIFDVDCNQYNTSFIPVPDNVFLCVQITCLFFKVCTHFMKIFCTFSFYQRTYFLIFFFITFIYSLSYKINKITCLLNNVIQSMGLMLTKIDQSYQKKKKKKNEIGRKMLFLLFICLIYTISNTGGQRKFPYNV